MSDSSPKTSWYREGLHFSCTRCGNCCTGEPGQVRVSDDEIEHLARRLGMENRDFREAYTRRLRRGEISLRERPNGECIFFSAEEGCGVYADRPRQCRTWPFWGSVVWSRERWDEEAQRCPGMNRGPMHDATVIQEMSAADGTSSRRRKG